MDMAPMHEIDSITIILKILQLIVDMQRIADVDEFKGCQPSVLPKVSRVTAAEIRCGATGR
jgi:hypothetical protein